MKVVSTFALAISLGAFAGAQTSAPPASAPSAAAPSESQQAQHAASSSDSNANAPVLGAMLAKTIDAKKAKQGDEVVAKTISELKTADGTVIPRNSKIIGHVTQVQAKGKGQDKSMLAIAFDKLQGKDKELPFHAVIQAVAPPPPIAALASDSAGPSTATPGSSGGTGGSAGASGASGMGAGSREGGSSSAIGSNAGGEPGSGGTASDPGASLNGNSHGVIGLKDVQLESASSGDGQGSILTSTSGNVKLESGTRMVLKVTPQ